MNKRLSTKHRKLAKESLQMLTEILHIAKDGEWREMSQTPYGYLGTNNMTMQQLTEHHSILKANLEKIRSK